MNSKLLFVIEKKGAVMDFKNNILPKNPKDTLPVESFIALIKKSPLLWDTHNRNFGQTHPTKEAWEMIASACHVQVSSAKSRWQRIKEQEKYTHLLRFLAKQDGSNVQNQATKSRTKYDVMRPLMSSEDELTDQAFFKRIDMKLQMLSKAEQEILKKKISGVVSEHMKKLTKI